MAPQGCFANELRRLAVDPAGREWWYLPYDQLSRKPEPLRRITRRELGVVLIECPGKARRRPYHQQKLALLLSNQRHFALELLRAGVAVDYRVAEESYATAVAEAAAEHGPLRMMRAAELELRDELRDLIGSGQLEEVDNASWLTQEADFLEAVGEEPPWRMDRFYRHVRRSGGWLMDGDKPEGGRFSFDGENRKPWRGEPSAPEAPRFRPDAITEEVVELVRARFGDHPGRLDATSLPASRSQVDRAWSWAKEHCLPHFGPYEDAMSRRSLGLFHTRISSLMNLGRLQPRDLIEDALALPIPLPSREGFLRQILGWREFVRHVHERTEGFRRFGGLADPFAAKRPLPAAFWGEPSGLSCLDHVVGEVWEHGYGHHITRLMVLGNLATLIGASARELSDWFRVAYTDAYDWVVEPNVLAMATFAAGDTMTTKPYVCGAAYIHRMSDFCQSCAFDPRDDCPITSLYWNFLGKHEEFLATLPRMRGPLLGLRRRSAAQRASDATVARRVRRSLESGEELQPERSNASQG